MIEVGYTRTFHEITSPTMPGIFIQATQGQRRSRFPVLHALYIGEMKEFR
jgi:hypothetical protein